MSRPSYLHPDFEDYYCVYATDWRGARVLMAEARSAEALALVLVLRFPVEVRRWFATGTHERESGGVRRVMGTFELQELGVLGAPQARQHPSMTRT